MNKMLAVITFRVLWASEVLKHHNKKRIHGWFSSIPADSLLGNCCTRSFTENLEMVLRICQFSLFIGHNLFDQLWKWLDEGLLDQIIQSHCVIISLQSLSSSQENQHEKLCLKCKQGRKQWSIWICCGGIECGSLVAQLGWKSPLQQLVEENNDDRGHQALDQGKL